MSENFQILVENFKLIVCDSNLDEADIRRYIQWAKGNLQSALNYYYRNLEKKNTNSKKQNTHLFDKLKKGAQKQKNTKQIINNLKKQYQLPVVSKLTSNNITQSQSKEFQDIDYIPLVMNYTQSQYTQKSMIIQHQIKQQIILKKQDNKYQQNIQETISNLVTDIDSLFLGQYILGCFSTSKNDVTGCNQGTQVYLKPVYVQKKIEKNVKKSKKIQQKMVMRVYWDNRQIGRVEDQETRILYNLLVNNYISISCTSLLNLTQLSYFTTFKVICKVKLQKKSFTIPIVQSFENQNSQNKILKQFGSIRQQLIALFMKLNLKIKQPPLIKLKSKYIKQQRKNKPSKISNQNQQQLKIQKQNQRKSLNQKNQQFNNPFYNPIQKNLKQMFNSKNHNDNPTQSIKQYSQKKQQNQIITRNVQLQQNYYHELVNLNEEDLQQTSPDDNFTSVLHPYQSLALTWMLRRQGKINSKEKQTLHPMWMEYQTIQKISFFFNQFTGQISLQPPYFLSKCKGGILADEMGLGKTVMLISLIVTNQCQMKKLGKNLIILPLTLLDQWEDEIKTHTKKKSIKVLKYYDKKDRDTNLTDYDVILTTYGVVSHQFAQGFHISKQGLFKVEWFRIILDEAHYIKGRVIQTAKAVFNLRSNINWCLTGTPIQNKLDDIFSLIHFIRYTPWSDYTWWNTYINKPHQQKDPIVFPILRTILKKVLLRRTKQTKLENGKPIIQLPKKTSMIQYLKFNQKQQKFYDLVYESSKKQFEELEADKVVEAKYMKIFQILMRLRQICCHPILFRSITKLSTNKTFASDLKKFIQKRSEQRQKIEMHSHYQVVMDQQGNQFRVQTKNSKLNQAYFEQVIQKIQQNILQICMICLSNVQYPIITSCLHIFCKTCIIQAIQTLGICPSCRKIIKRQDFISLPRENRMGMDFKKDFYRSTKMQALMIHLKKLQPQDKVVIFSQFLGMIDLLEEDFKNQKLNYLRMDGSLSQKERSKVIDTFKNDQKYKIFIISLKSGGVGLNLTVANKVFLIDPWWNPAVQEQAIQRVHRIGQKKEVNIIRFIIQNSIQSRMMQLHENKRNISNMAISEKQSKQMNYQKFKYLMSKY